MAERHEKIWHYPRDIWSCPTKDDLRAEIHLQAGPLACYLFPTTQQGEMNSEDVCPYCGEYCDELFDDLDGRSDNNFDDWKVRIQHLECQHNFDQCLPTAFYKLDNFLLHLAGSHNLRLSPWTKKVINSCWREKRTLAEIMSVSIVGDDIPKMWESIT